VPRAAVVAYNT